MSDTDILTTIGREGVANIGMSAKVRTCALLFAFSLKYFFEIVRFTKINLHSILLPNENYQHLARESFVEYL